MDFKSCGIVKLINSFIGSMLWFSGLETDSQTQGLGFKSRWLHLVFTRQLVITLLNNHDIIMRFKSWSRFRSSNFLLDNSECFNGNFVNILFSKHLIENYNKFYQHFINQLWSRSNYHANSCCLLLFLLNISNILIYFLTSYYQITTCFPHKKLTCHYQQLTIIYHYIMIILISNIILSNVNQWFIM